MDAAEAHRQLIWATGARPGSPSAVSTPPAGYADAVWKLVETAEEVIDNDGREVWLTSGEIELDQWTQRLTEAAAAVRRQLGGTP